MEEKDFSGCSTCINFKDGKGNTECLKCKPINQAANHGNYYHRGFLTDDELIQDVNDNSEIKSIFKYLIRVEPRDREIFESYMFADVSMNTLAREHGVSRQAIYKIIRGVRLSIKKQMGLSTVF